jgi:hypothetical protein
LDWFLMSDAELWQRMLPLATGAAVSPLVLLGQLAQLSGAGGRLVALRRSLGYLLGALAVVVIWTLAAGWIAHRLPSRQPGADPVAAAVQLLLALALAALALQTLRRPLAAATPVPPCRDGTTGLWAALLQGLGLMAVNVTSLVLFLPAAQLVGRSAQPWSERLAAWLALDLITLLPVWLPPLLLLLSGPVGARLLDRFGRWVSRHRRAIDAAVAAGFALLLAVRGLQDL